MATRLANLIVSIQGDVAGLRSAAAEAEKQLGKIEKGTNSLGASLKRTFENAAGFGIERASEGVLELGKSVISTGINFNAMKEQAEIAFTTMLGSGGKAKAFLDELQAFAAKTPFEFKDLVTASQRMMAMGFASQEVLPTLTAVGDAVAAMGGGQEQIDQVTRALGQLQAKGKASAEEMLQLTEAGIPAWENLARKIGTSVPEAMDKVSKGVISSRTVIDAQIEGINEKFGGMMAQQSKTFNGMLSNLSDTFQQASGQVIKPFFLMVEEGLVGITQKAGEPGFANAVDENVTLPLLRAAAQAIETYQQIKRVFDFAGQANSGFGLLPKGLNITDLLKYGTAGLNPINLLRGGTSGSVGSGGLDLSNPASVQARALENELALRKGEGNGSWEQALSDYNQSLVDAAPSVKEQASATYDLGKAAGAAKEAIDPLVEAMKDGIISLQEAWDNNLSPAQAAVMEAEKILADARYDEAAKVFDLEKAHIRLQAVYDQNIEAARKMEAALASEALEKLKAAQTALFGAPTREVADLSVQLAGINQAIAQNAPSARAFEANARETITRINEELANLQDQRKDAADKQDEGRIGSIDRRINELVAQRGGLEQGDRLANNLEMLRTRTQEQIDVLQAQTAVQQAQLTAADQTLITQRDQVVAAAELTGVTRDLTGYMRDSGLAAFDFQQQMREATRAVTDFRSIVDGVTTGSSELALMRP